MVIHIRDSKNNFVVVKRQEDDEEKVENQKKINLNYYSNTRTLRIIIILRIKQRYFYC